MLNRIFVRENQEDNYSKVKNKLKIGVIGIGASVGASLIGTSLAKELSNDKQKHIGYVEIPQHMRKNYLFDSLGMDKRFAGRKFFNLYKEVAEGRNISNLTNLDERINWALQIPKTMESSEDKELENIELENIELCRLINNIAADIVICDISINDKREELLKDVDYVVCVIDPLPSKVINGYDEICKIKRYNLMEHKVLWVVNKYNEGINIKELNEFIKIKNYIKIPAISIAEFYTAEYNCKLPYSMKSVNSMLKPHIQKIIHQLNT